MKLRFLLPLLLFCTVAFAELRPVRTSYSTEQFSASFNGPVSVETRDNWTRYYSITNGVEESVFVVHPEHTISVDLTSSRWYRNSNVWTGETLKEGLNADSDITFSQLIGDDPSTKKHPMSYGLYVSSTDGVTYWRRTNYVIVSDHLVLWVLFKATEDFNHSDAGFAEYMTWDSSLRIK